MESLAVQMKEMSHSFRFIRNHFGRKCRFIFNEYFFICLEFVVHSDQFENEDRSISIDTHQKLNRTFFILSKLPTDILLNDSSKILNSDIIHLNNLANLPVTFRHFVSERKCVE